MGDGNDGLWKARKTIMPFSDLPTNLGNRCAIIHISPAPTTMNLKSSPQGAIPDALPTKALQAHSRIGKDCFRRIRGGRRSPQEEKRTDLTTRRKIFNGS